MRIRASALLAAGAFALLATSAGAQEYGTYYSGPPAYGPSEEQVIVTPPPYARQRGDLGGPIINVSMSQGVRFDDLDLNSDWGVRRLKWRVHTAALNMCNRLDTMYPISVDGDRQTCYRDAVADAMEQVHDVVGRARANWQAEDR